jgi:hypothetical protein
MTERAIDDTILVGPVFGHPEGDLWGFCVIHGIAGSAAEVGSDLITSTSPALLGVARHALVDTLERCEPRARDVLLFDDELHLATAASMRWAAFEELVGIVEAKQAKAADDAAWRPGGPVGHA